MIPIYEPYLERYTQNAINAINSNWISNYGEFINKAEEKMKELMNVKYCILMNNGTSATHSLLLSVKFKYPQIKTIYVPNNVFIAPINCVLKEYEMNNIEVMKINYNTMNINTNEEYIKSLKKNSCVLIVHNLGNIVNVPKLQKIRPDLIFVEDNCEGFFGKYNNIYSGTATNTLCSAVSFYANKYITTGEGGAFLTNHEDVYNHIKSVYSHGMTNERYIHDIVSYNYRMTNIEAAFLYSQLMDIDHIHSLKKKVFDNYHYLLKELYDCGKIKKIESEIDTISANWMYCIIINDLNYNDIESYMNDNSIQIRPIFYDLRQHIHLKDININYPELQNKNLGIMIPSHPHISYSDQTKVCDSLKKYFNFK